MRRFRMDELILYLLSILTSFAIITIALTLFNFLMAFNQFRQDYRRVHRLDSYGALREFREF